MKNGTSLLGTRFKKYGRFSIGINVKKIPKETTIESKISKIINKSIGENVLKDATVIQIIKIVNKEMKGNRRINSIIRNTLMDVLLKEKTRYERELRYTINKIRDKYVKMFSIPKTDSERLNTENLIKTIAEEGLKRIYNSTAFNGRVDILRTIETALKALE